jgi:aldehyde:ferredoxin oxidoreductase
MGSIEFLETMIKKICSRQGFGSVLSEGAIRASETVGKQSREVTRNLLTQSGRAIAYGPKVFFPSALIYATEPRPLITELHEVCEPLTKWALWYTSKGEKSYVSTDVLRKIAEKFWGSQQAVDFSTYEGKTLASFLIQNRQFAKESLILCDFAWPVYDDAGTENHVGDPTLESQLLSAVTGREIDEKELNHIAERIFALYRAILLREGRKGREDDCLPEFFFVEREEFIADVFGMHNPELFLPASGDEVISRKGKAVDKEKFEKMKDEYYELRGWDIKTGLLKKDTLKKLDLNEVIEPLKEKAV